MHMWLHAADVLDLFPRDCYHLWNHDAVGCADAYTGIYLHI